MAMSVVSHTQSFSSILKTSNSFIKDKQVQRGRNRVRFSLPKNLREILENYINKTNEKPYNKLIDSLKDEIEDLDLEELLKNVRRNIYLLDRNLSKFVDSLIALQWLNRAPDTIKEYQGFILDVISAYNYYTTAIVGKLIKDFYFSEDASPWKNSLPSDEDESKYENIHYLLKNILKNIPLSYDIIDDAVFQNLNHYKRTEHNLECYLHNMLKMCKYKPKPFSRVKFLYYIIKLLIDLDARSPKHELCEANDNNMTDENIDEASSSVFPMEIDENNEDDKSYINHKFGKNLDCLLNYLFIYIQKEFALYESGNNLRKWNLFDDFLKCFENIILPSHQIEHTQFLLFYICSLKNTFAERFLLFLWKKVSSPTLNDSPTLRLTTMHYLGSFLARANYISMSTLINYIKKMANWIHEYIANKDDQEPLKLKDRLFYYVCQNFFYIIAFRHNDLVNSNKNLIFLQSLNLAEIVNCKLNPFKYCQIGIVKNLASFASKYQLAFLHLKIEENARYCLPIEFLNDENEPCAGKLKLEVETHFPFDPYLLKATLHWIKPLYRLYQPLESDDDQEKESFPLVADNSTSRDEEDDFLMTTSTSPTANTTAVELFSLSTSPPFRMKH